MRVFTTGQLAEHVSGRLEGDPARRVSGVASLKEAGPEDLTFLANRRGARPAENARPAAIVVPEAGEFAMGDAVLIRVPRPQIAFGKIVRLFHPDPEHEAGVSRSAVIGSGVRLEAEVRIGPYAVLGSEVEVGRGTRIGAHTVVGDGAKIGRACVIADSCSILGSVRMGDRVRVQTGARLGTEGYGYAEDEGGAVRIPQVGGCIVGDEVEIGANTTIDRGALGDTEIGAGTKIDNMVHIGHNVRIGENCMIVAQVGVAGSVTVGDGAQLGGQAGVAGHLTIGSGTRIAAQAGVIGDVPPDETWSGYPARPHRQAMRASAALFRLPDLVRRLRALERRAESNSDSG